MTDDALTAASFPRSSQRRERSVEETSQTGARRSRWVRTRARHTGFGGTARGSCGWPFLGPFRGIALALSCWHSVSLRESGCAENCWYCSIPLMHPRQVADFYPVWWGFESLRAHTKDVAVHRLSILSIDPVSLDTSKPVGINQFASCDHARSRISTLLVEEWTLRSGRIETPSPEERCSAHRVVTQGRPAATTRGVSLEIVP